MIADIHHPVWAQIVTGKKQFMSRRPTLNLLIQSNKMSYERDPSPANVEKLVAKTHNFFVQFEALFADEIKGILR